MPAIDLEVVFINSNHGMARVDFTHPNQAEVRQIGMPVPEAIGQLSQAGQVSVDFKVNHQKSGLDQTENQSRIPEMISAFRQNGFTGQQGFRNLACQCQCPLVVPVMPIRKGHDETGIRDTFHFLLNPLRVERPRGPETVPANCMNFPLCSSALARSSCSRIIFPCEIPDSREVVSSHSASSGVRRIVIV